MASGIALRLHRAGIRRIYMLEIDQPLAVRRRVCFSEAVYRERTTVEEVTAVAVVNHQAIPTAWSEGHIAVLVDPKWHTLQKRPPHVLVDAILAKRNMGTLPSDAPLTIGLGPGFVAGQDVHVVIETNRGHDLGRLITRGEAAANTGTPGNIAGQTTARVLRSPARGLFTTVCRLGERVTAGQVVGRVGSVPVSAQIDGLVRGLLRSNRPVTTGMKLGDIDPRSRKEHLDSVSDKARTLGGSVLEAILGRLDEIQV